MLRFVRQMAESLKLTEEETRGLLRTSGASIFIMAVVVVFFNFLGNVGAVTLLAATCMIVGMVVAIIMRAAKAQRIAYVSTLVLPLAVAIGAAIGVVIIQFY